MKSELKPCFESRAVAGTRLFPLTSAQLCCLAVEPRKARPADPNLEGAGGTLLPRDTHPTQPSSVTLGLKFPGRAESPQLGPVPRKQGEAQRNPAPGGTEVLRIQPCPMVSL